VSGSLRTSAGSAALLVSLLAAFGSLAGCGQRGPLTLPGAEPTAPNESSTAPSGTTGDAPDPSEPVAEDEDEPIQNER
jgi:predicted small lipoprotein YifL